MPVETPDHMFGWDADQDMEATADERAWVKWWPGAEDVYNKNRLERDHTQR